MEYLWNTFQISNFKSFEMYLSAFLDIFKRDLQTDSLICISIFWGFEIWFSSFLSSHLISNLRLNCKLQVYTYPQNHF